MVRLSTPFGAALRRVGPALALTALAMLGGLAAGLAHTRTPGAPVMGAGQPPVCKPFALLQLDEKSRWATRVHVDREQLSLSISRELVYGDEPSPSIEADDWLIPDEAESLQLTVFDRTIGLADMEVRIVLRRFGPTEAWYDRPGTSTEINLWINGQTRAVGFLEPSARCDDGSPVWERLAIYRRGGAMSGTTCFGKYPLVRRGTVNGNLSTDRAWILEPADTLPPATESERSTEEVELRTAQASMRVDARAPRRPRKAGVVTFLR